MTLQEIIDRVYAARDGKGWSETDKQRSRVDMLNALILDLEIAQRRALDRGRENGTVGA